MSQETSPELQALQAKGVQPSTHVFSNRKEVRQEILAMAAEPKSLTLKEKIAAISKAVPMIKRTGKNKDQNYKYLKIEDVVDAIRPMLETHRLLLEGQVTDVKTVPDPKGVLFQIEMVWNLVDMDSGDFSTWRIPGSGWDYHDKGLYKAITGSRKYAHIVIFNLPIGDEPEAQAGGMDRESAKAAQKNVAATKLAAAAGRGEEKAVELMSQLEQEKKVLISRPEQANGHYIAVSGFLAVPQLERFFDDTNSKRFKSKVDNTPYWRVPSEYEKGLIAICSKLGIEVEG